MVETTSAVQEALEDMRELTAYGLAGLADCSAPDTLTAPGAGFLTLIRDALVESVEYAVEHGDGTVSSDDLAEMADGAVPTYTHPRWLTFTDLAAWQEDLSDIAGNEQEMTDMAGYALYMIAERLLNALHADYLSGLEDGA